MRGEANRGTSGKLAHQGRGTLTRQEKGLGQRRAGPARSRAMTTEPQRAAKLRDRQLISLERTKQRAGAGTARQANERAAARAELIVRP
ncbi:hypothetical protein V6N13_053500 [Hibiscus sabdariffa]